MDRREGHILNVPPQKSYCICLFSRQLFAADLTSFTFHMLCVGVHTNFCRRPLFLNLDFLERVKYVSC